MAESDKAYIVSRWDKTKVLYRAESAQDVRAAVIEAREKGANLRDADLWDAKGAPIVVHGLPSGTALLHLTDAGWQIRVGCWTGSPDELETLIEGDEWPEAKGAEQARRRLAPTDYRRDIQAARVEARLAA